MELAAVTPDSWYRHAAAVIEQEQAPRVPPYDWAKCVVQCSVGAALEGRDLCHPPFPIAAEPPNVPACIHHQAEP